MSAAIFEQGTPFSEAVWREFQNTSIFERIYQSEARSQTRTKHGISETISSSKSSGSKCKEPELDDDSDEEAPAPKKAVAAKKRKTGKKGKKGKKGKRPKKKAEPSNKVESESDSSDCSVEVLTFAVRPTYIPGVLCSICDGAHFTPCCPIQTVVPPNTHINDGYVRSCRRCGRTVDPSLFCPRCRTTVRALIRSRS